MKRQKMFLDFDNVMVDTVSAYCNLYALRFAEHPLYEPPNPGRVWRFDMKDECPLVEDQRAMWADRRLYGGDALAPGGCGFFDADTEAVLARLDERFDITVCTLGSAENVANKLHWLWTNMRDALSGLRSLDFLFHCTGRYWGKQSINMEGAVFVDDNMNNLVTSNAAVKVCFGRYGEWNHRWDGLRATSWRELERVLNAAAAQAVAN